MVAGMHSALEFLGAGGDPGDGPAEPPRGDAERDVFGKEEILHPEATTNIRAMQPEGGLRQAEHLGQLGAGAMHAHPRMHQVEAARGDAGQCGAGFDRRGMDALVDDPAFHNMGGGGEGRLGRGTVAALEAEGEVAGRLRPDLWSFRAQRNSGPDRRRQRRVVDVDRFHRIDRRGFGGGDHQRYGFANVADGIDGQRGARRNNQRPEGRDLHRAGQRRQALGRQIGTGQHQQHARHGPRRSRIEAADAGMRVRAAQDDTAGRARRDQVGCETPGPRQEPRILPPPARQSNRSLGHAKLRAAQARRYSAIRS